MSGKDEVETEKEKVETKSDCKVKENLCTELSPEHVFEVPKKRVLNSQDIPVWEKSEAYQVSYRYCDKTDAFRRNRSTFISTDFGDFETALSLRL